MSLREPKRIIYWVSLPVVFLIFGCAVPERRPCFKDNRDCSKIDYLLDRQDWDSCYLLGCSYMDCNCLDLAAEEFKRAISERPRDKKRARTYGMHFIRYFPHREMGIIYYRKGQIQEAIEELERSLRDSPSSKGKYFLNQARRAWLIENDLDHISPTIHVTFPEQPFYFTNQSEIRIEGYAQDDRFVSGVSINGEPVFFELAAETIRFARTIPLALGRNPVTVTTQDLSDRATEKVIEITVDKTGPFIHFTHSTLVSARREGGVLIRGMAFDDSGVGLLSVNGKTIELRDRKNPEFSHWVPLTGDIKQVSLLAEDIAGNETRGYIDLSAVKGTGRLLSPSFEKGSMAQTDIQSRKGGIIRLAALDDSIPCLISSNDRMDTDKGLYNKSTMAPPFNASIKIDPLPRTTIFKEIYVSAEIRYQTDISDVTILVNGKPAPMAPCDLDWMDKIFSKINKLFGKKELKSLILSKIIELDLGQNEVVIELCIDNGLIRSKPVYVLRKRDEMREMKYRMNVAVMPVNDISAIYRFAPFTWSSSAGMKDYVFIKLNEAFIKQKRFQIVNRKWLKQILFEQKLAASDLTDKEKVIEVGRLASAESIMSCDMRVRMGDSIELIGLMIDTETSLEIWSDDIYLPWYNDQIPAEAAVKLAMKIRQHFPLCKGKVLARKGAKIKVDLGHNDGICEHTRLIVYREEEWDSRVLAGARVESVYDDHARASLLNEERHREVNAADLVITR